MAYRNLTKNFLERLQRGQYYAYSRVGSHVCVGGRGQITALAEAAFRWTESKQRVN